ncbi:MAG: esterase-like activity of phytase family protein [Rhodospirillales bacterium]|nr:esterase-like activity of phytase family protein [Rhodospirillales bacterium]MBO6786778.1 esterase-like activity of phytase family protein [Rhodospirillales bacterium]
MKCLRTALLTLALAVMPLLAGAEPVDIEVTPIPLVDSRPGETSVGVLNYRGGLHLVSRDPRFGGFSGLGLSADGRRMVSVSDAAVSFSAELTYDADGNLSGIDKADLGTLSDLDGTPLRGKRWTDAEAMSPGVEGEIIVAFERDHRLWRYDPGSTVPRVLRPPDELASMPGNDGIEALTLLQDGRLLAISEGSPDEPVRVGWVSSRNGWDVLTYQASDGFRPTGAATLPDGDVVVLERYFTPRAGVRIRIMRIAVADIQPGATISGTLLAGFAPPMNIDNFEGIEALAGQGGSTHLYLISDDNFNRGEQRTLLMMFELPGQ